MTRNFCDRCGRETRNKAAFLVPCNKDYASIQVNGVWFGDPITLCKSCLDDFEKFRIEHQSFNRILEKDWD